MDVYECFSLSNCLSMSYFMCKWERDECRGACKVWTCILGFVCNCVRHGDCIIMILLVITAVVKVSMCQYA